MKPIDTFSYELGAADCFCEMVRAGVKRLALAHPCDSPQERDQYLPYFEELCRKYGVKLYVEDEAFLTDLFPLSLNQGKYNALFYQEGSALQEYLALKGEKKAALAQGTYDQARRDIAWRFGTLPAYHRKGAGRALLAWAERYARAAGWKLLQVKTLDASHPSPEYARTRAFYHAMGFVDLECFPTLWDAGNPCLVLVKAL